MDAAMAAESGKKLFVGPRFRRIRQQLGLSQTQIAEGLGISPSYINLIERNQRPVTAPSDGTKGSLFSDSHSRLAPLSASV